MIQSRETIIYLLEFPGSKSKSITIIFKII